MSVDQVSYSGHDLEALFDLRNYQKWIADCFAPYLRGDVVEFGAGIGAMSQWLVPKAERIDLVEPSANLVTQLAARFADRPHVRVTGETLQAYVAGRPEGSVDTAVLVNLLEHIEDDGAALRSLAGMLRGGGHLLVFVPAMPSLYSEIDRIVGHHRRYTRRGLGDVVSQAGFDIVRLRYFDMLGVLPWWAVNTIGSKKRFDPNLSTLYDRVGVPITRALEAVVPPPVGKNLILIARRRAAGGETSLHDSVQ